MTTGILMNCLDIAAVNDWVTWCCKVQRSMLVPVCREFTANPIANGTSFIIQQGVCVGRELSGEGICLKEISLRNVRENCRCTRHPREIRPGEKCRDIYVGLQVCMCSGYDCATLVNIQTHSQTDSQTSFDRLYY